MTTVQGNTSATAPSSYMRLHITPFDSDLFNIVVPAAVLPAARNVSYHGLQVFPEKRYGFVELPSDVAEKLRRKLNGAVLKGVKLRIEPAHVPQQERLYEQERQTAANMPTLEPQHKKKTKDIQEDGRRVEHLSNSNGKHDKKRQLELAQLGGPAGETLSGIQLEPGRQVKRGWTQTTAEASAAAVALARSRKARKEAKHEKKAAEKQKRTEQRRQQRDLARRQRSQFTDQPECLLKTVLPANKAPRRPPLDGTADGADAATLAHSCKAAKKAREIVVHEFAHATKFPTFLKDQGVTADAHKSLEFVDGTGWVDAAGQVVQPLKTTRPTKITAKMDQATIDRLRTEKAGSGQNSDSSDSVSETDSDSSSDGGSDDNDGKEKLFPKKDTEMVHEDSQSDSEEDRDASSTSESSSGASDQEEEEKEDGGQRSKKHETLMGTTDDVPSSPRPKSSGSMRSLTIEIPPPPATPAAASKMHPLEALYKREKNDDDAVARNDNAGSGFRFFGTSAGVDDNDDDVVCEPTKRDVMQPPMTPFSKQEYEWRNQRSAAPTPDTAHPSRARSFEWPAHNGSKDDEDDEGDDDEGADGQDKTHTEKAGDKAEGDFQSWFWDNRGELNRAWKKRRKAAAKDKRYRENRTRAERAI